MSGGLGRRAIAVVYVAALLVIAGASASAGVVYTGPDVTRAHPAAKSSLVIGVPAYLNPNSHGWPELTGNQHPGFFVADVTSHGPGPSAIPKLGRELSKAVDSGVVVYGYVDTGYLGQSAAQLNTLNGRHSLRAWLVQARQQADLWFRYYPKRIGGIFFDQQLYPCGRNGDQRYADAYTRLKHYIHTRYAGANTIDNPGVPVPRCYEHAADTLLTFEGPARKYLDHDSSYARLPWMSHAPASKFWEVVYDCPTAARMKRVLQVAVSRHVRSVYATDLGEPNPWFRLPNYFPRELTAASNAG